MAGYEPLGPDQVRWYSYRAELTVNGKAPASMGHGDEL